MTLAEKSLVSESKFADAADLVGSALMDGIAHAVRDGFAKQYSLSSNQDRLQCRLLGLDRALATTVLRNRNWYRKRHPTLKPECLFRVDKRLLRCNKSGAAASPVVFVSARPGRDISPPLSTGS